MNAPLQGFNEDAQHSYEITQGLTEIMTVFSNSTLQYP